MHRIKLLLRFPLRNYLKSNVWQPLRRILPFILPYWKTYLFLILFLFLNIIITFIMAWFLKTITDAAISKDFELLKKLFIFGLCLLVLNSLTTYLHSYIESATYSKVTRDLKIALFHKTLRLRTEQFNQYHSGELLSRLTNDIHSAAGLIGSNLLDLIRLPILFVAVFIYLASMNWKLSIVSLSVSPFIVISGVFFGLLLKDNGKLILETQAKINSLLNDVLAGYTVVRCFSLERLMYGRYKEHCHSQLLLEMKSAKLSGGMGAGSSIAGGAAYFLNLGFGAYLVAHDALTVGSLLAFLSLMQHLVYPFMGMASSWSNFQYSVSAFERVWEILGSESEFIELPSSERSHLSSVAVECRNVSFHYERDTKVIDHLDVVIPAGRVAAIVGPSGAGKSTLFKLLLGLYTPPSGEILLNGRSLLDLNQEELRSLIAYVPQESYLFDGTIRENLLHGYPHASEIELIKAAKDANIHDFIMTLPERYDSRIGERGVRLSGGQKQRIAIARAILKNAPLLLLDEATSALDNENEVMVQESLGKLMKGRTTIVIAHRLSTIQNADWILVMDNGKVVAQGTHEMLLNQDNPYSRMFYLQFRDRGILMEF
jgi:ATP-binding cassette, subfamily B, bacterial